MTFSKSRIKTIRRSNYEKYTKALEVEHVIPALHRIVELQPRQRGSTLIETDARIEYTALLSLVHDITEGHSKAVNVQALSIWMLARDMALTATTFNPDGYTERPEPEHEETLKRLLRASAEREARRKDSILMQMAQRLAAKGTLEDKVVHKPRSEQFTKYLEAQKPPDVAAIVASVLNGEVADAVPASQE